MTARPPKLDAGPRRNRVASDEELALWQAATKDAAPLALSRRVGAPKVGPRPVRPAFRASPPQSGTHTPSRTTYPDAPAIDFLTDRTPGLDSKTAKALRRGAREPEARVDLHGMTLARAHAALNRFILAERRRGSRCVLVITGKGGDYRNRAGGGWQDGGVLRQDVPRWLREPALADSVIGIYQAHRRHGGDGAFYVYLRKAR